MFIEQDIKRDFKTCKNKDLNFIGKYFKNNYGKYAKFYEYNYIIQKANNKLNKYNKTLNDLHKKCFNIYPSYKNEEIFIKIKLYGNLRKFNIEEKDILKIRNILYIIDDLNRSIVLYKNHLDDYKHFKDCIKNEYKVLRLKDILESSLENKKTTKGKNKI